MINRAHFFVNNQENYKFLFRLAFHVISEYRKYLVNNLTIISYNLCVKATKIIYNKTAVNLYEMYTAVTESQNFSFLNSYAF